MGALARLQNGIKLVDLRHRSGFMSETVQTGEYIGASYIFGRIHGQYRDKAQIRGVPVNLLAGLVGKIGSLGASALGMDGSWAPHLNTVANAGLGSYFHAMGVAHGMKSAGRSVYILEKGAAVPAGLPAPTTALGDIPPAPAGSYLTPEEIADLARQR